MKTKKYILPLILILLLTFTLAGYGADLFGTYDKRIKLTIDNTKIDSALSDFPVTVFFTSTQAEEIFSEFDADSDYMKCAFTSSDGTTQLYAEKELFNVTASYISQYPPAQSDTYVKATTKFDTNYWAYYATDPTKSLTGSYAGNSWNSSQGVYINQRFHIDLGSAKVIKRIYYENTHSSGAQTNRGVQHFTFWGSNTGAGSFDDLVYANDEGWTQLTISQGTFDQHTASDVADPKYITVTNSTAYRYYAFKFADNYGSTETMGVRRIELQTQSPKAIYHVKVTSVSSSAGTDIYYYYDNDASDNTTYIGAINTTAGGNVWDSNFKAVYHMVDATTSTVVDSTSNSNDGTKKATNEPIEATGKVGQAQDFDGTDDYIDIPKTFSIFDGQNFTLDLCLYIPAEGYTEWKHAICFWGERYVSIRMNNATADNIQFNILDEIDNYVEYVPGSLGQWFHVVGVRDTSTGMTLYINGTSEDTNLYTGDPTSNSNANSCLMAEGDHTRPAEGKEDEVRISSTARSAAWIKATYNSLWDSLLTYGSEETKPVEEEGNALFFGMNF